MQQRSSLPAFALVSPVQLMVGGIIFLPAIYVLWLSLHQSSFGQAASFVGLANYAKVLGDPYFWRALVNTVIVVAIVVHVELLLGLMMALFFASGIPFRALMLAIVLAPYAVSEVSAVVMWRYLFEPDVGMMSRLLGTLGLPPIEWSVNPSHGLLMVCLLSIWLHLPFSFIILYAARLSVPDELYEAAAIDGATGWDGVSPDHLAAADAGAADRGPVPLHLRLPAVLRGLADDRWRAGPQHRGAGGLSLSRSVPLQRLRRSRRDRLAARARLAPARAVLSAWALPGDVRQACLSSRSRS
jgi:ABC-type spermidine/putrescine transport system permease subunit II